MPFAQQLQEVDSAFASGTLEPSEELIAYMSAVPVLARMPRAGIVHIDVVGYLQTGRKHAILLKVESIFLFGQDSTNLPR